MTLWRVWADIAGAVLLAQIAVWLLIGGLRWRRRRRERRVWQNLERRLK